MRRVYLWAAGFAAVAAVLGGVVAAGPPQSSNAAATSTPRPVLDKYCVTCHNQRLKTAGLTLDTIDAANIPAAADTWEKVVRKLRAGSMPPPSSPRPDQATYDALISHLESSLDRAAVDHPNPGRTDAFHRLNRSEYHNAVRDLIGLDVDVTSLVPADAADEHGFDNMAGVLSVSPVLLERYGAATANQPSARGARAAASGRRDFGAPSPGLAESK